MDCPSIAFHQCRNVSDTSLPTISEASILGEIQDISNKITTKKTFNLNSIGNYAQILKTLEDNRSKFIEGKSIDLKPLQSFASSAQQLTNYMNGLIERFKSLADINNENVMTDIHSNIEKIDTFVKTSELLFQMMDHPEQFEWYTKYNDTVLSIKNSMNAYEKIAKQITYQLSEPMTYVNPAIKNLTELFNNNYSNNPLPQNFLNTHMNNVPTLGSIGSSGFPSALAVIEKDALQSPVSNAPTSAEVANSTKSAQESAVSPHWKLVIDGSFFWNNIFTISLVILVVILLVCLYRSRK